MDACVIVPTVGSSSLLQQVLERVAPARVAVVTDGGESTLETPTDVLVVRHDRTRGYGAACNSGVAALRPEPTDALVFLNDDALPHDAFLSDLMRLEDDHVGVIGWHTQGPQGDRPRYPGHATGAGYVHSGPTLDGCAFAMRASLFLELGGFDESFGMYGEETDLFARVLSLGLELLELPGPVWHQEETSMAGLPMRRAWYGMRNPLRVAMLNYRPAAAGRAVASLLVHAWTPRWLVASTQPHVRRKRALSWVVRAPMSLLAVLTVAAELPVLLRRRRAGARRGHLARATARVEG